MAAADEDDFEPAERKVAIYNFDPSTVDWPFRQQRPLPLTTGQVIQVIHDDGSEWALGQFVGRPEVKGYFPKNYTVSVAEYHEMMKDYEAAELDEQPEEDPEAPRGPPETRAFPPEGALPVPESGERLAPPGAPGPPGEAPELVYPGLAHYPVLEGQPPLATTFEPTKSRLLREMPPVPEPAPERPATPKDDILAARAQVERELAAREDPMRLAGGQLSDSRASTPATRAMTRPELDFVRRRAPDEAPPTPGGAGAAGAAELDAELLTQVSPLQELVLHAARAPPRAAALERPPYQADLRVRFTSVRLASGIEPAHMRTALMASASTGARWTQMFRPGFNDVVNESFKVGCNACILSRAYLNDQASREQFQKLHGSDVNGTLWFELQRRKDHYFYLRMDFVDVMMCHPHAWNFPDTNRIVSAIHGEPHNPFHGWHAQVSIDTDREMEDVDFLYTMRLREFPEQTFQAMALGKVPEWIKPYASLHAETQPPDELKLDDEEAEAGRGHGKAIDVDNNLLMEAGLEDGDDLYVKLDTLRLARERTTGPEVLDAKTMSYKLKGLSAMRIFLRSRGCPDNMKQSLITPKMVKDMAAQLGIRGDPAHYWYCLFALRYSLAPEWEAVVRNDTRWYLHLPSDRRQPVHPMIKRFREHLDDCTQNEFLWDYRGFVKMKCSECGLPDSVIWCQQCTDYFCAGCFLRSHKSKRGRKHWPMPIPGCRYLAADEARQLSEHCPLLNIGFSNRRRFLARSNQSDRDGSRNGEAWLFFHADTFPAALVQAPEEHWFLRRLQPPRLAPGVEGYFYNFASDVIADDSSHILVKAHEQRAISLLQKNIRGALTRRHIQKETCAAVVIQKTKLMWDVQKVHGNNGKNAALLKSWYRKHRAKQEGARLDLRISRVQSLWQGYLCRREFGAMMRSTTRFQAAYRGLLDRRRVGRLADAALRAQRCLRGHLRGRRPAQQRRAAAAAIQALARGVAQRGADRRRRAAAARIQAHARGLAARRRVRRMQAAGLALQRNWRRFQAQLEVKALVYARLEEARQRRRLVLREKLQDAAALLVQRNWRRHRDCRRVDATRREKGEADKRTSTLLVALFTAAAAVRHYVHPWWRHLPPEIRDVLQQIKGPLQRTMGLVPVSGKLANEELGRRGLRVASARDLTYECSSQDPDLASHVLLSVSRHLLSHVPAELFEPTVRWACYAVGHQAVKLHATPGAFPKEEIPVGKEMPPHPGDSLATLWQDLARSARHHHDTLMTTSDESFPCLILSGLPTHQRHVFLTAEVLVTMRQALDSASLNTDDHLKFQGLDASAGAQLMEVLGCEIDHRLPLDWPKTHGTVASLASQMSTRVTELRPEPRGKVRGADLAHFNRSAILRGVQQVGYFMRGQAPLLNAILARADDEAGAASGSDGGQQGVRQSRYIVVMDKLFEMADRAKHDHCSFVLAVVLFHLTLRSLLLRVLYHRAAIRLQKGYGYLMSRGKTRNAVAPAICIQRFWRGLRAALLVMRRDAAAERVQRSYRAWRWQQRSRALLSSTLLLQRVWRGAVQRRWLRECHLAATAIQRCGRGLLVRAALDRAGRELARRQQAEMTALLRRRGELPEAQYAARTAALAAKARVALHRHRERRVELLRMASFSLKSKHARALDKQRRLRAKGALQPVRLSVFEPMAFALKRLEPRQPGRHGPPASRVLAQVRDAQRALDRTSPSPSPSPGGRAAPPRGAGRAEAPLRRGRAATAARRLAKRPQALHPRDSTAGSALFAQWLAAEFAVKQ